MIRVVVAALLAVGLLAGATPAIESARVDRTADAVAGEVATLERAALALTEESDPVPPRRPGARLTVRIRLPERSLTSLPVERLTVGADRADVAYALPGREPRAVVFPGVDLRGVEGPVRLRDSGGHRLRLRYVRIDDGPVVTVAREEQAISGEEQAIQG